MRAALAVLVVLAAAEPARADDPPWAKGVTAEQKAQAQDLLDAGNTKFVEHDYVAALVSYQRAIAVWDHPAIRFNIVRCLIQLDRPLDADDELTRALAYGAAPLEDAVYAEALSYKKLLAAQVGHVTLSCTQPGVELALDGKPALACPGTTDVRVAPGAHAVIGTRDGYAPHTARLVVVGGAHETAAVTLVPLARAGVAVRRWASWKPWVVTGAGLGVAALGALVDYQASRDMTSYDAQLVGACHDTGCSTASHPIPTQLAQLATSARRESDVGVSLIGAGALAALVGGALLYVNREHMVFPAEHVMVAPEAGGASVLLHGRF